jgi:hypothetical protein
MFIRTNGEKEWTVGTGRLGDDGMNGFQSCQWQQGLGFSSLKLESMAMAQSLIRRHHCVKELDKSASSSAALLWRNKPFAS